MIKLKTTKKEENKIRTFDCIVSGVPNGFTVVLEADLINRIIGVEMSEHSHRIADKNVQFTANLLQTVVQICKALEQEAVEMVACWFRSFLTLKKYKL